jgi:hypothetical protein
MAFDLSSLDVLTSYNDGVTVVVIVDPNCGHEIASGSAKCHPNDYPSMVVGAQVAMVRALNNFADTLAEELDFDF